MIDIEKLEAVPTFVLLGKDDCQTVAAYVYENRTLIDLDLSREAGGFVFLDTDCRVGAEEYNRTMCGGDFVMCGSDDLEGVVYKSTTQKAFVIRYHCEDGEARVIGYCYTKDGCTMYGEYLKNSAGGSEVVQWHGKSAEELMQYIAWESKMDLNNKSIVYKGYKSKETSNTPQDFPKVRAAALEYSNAIAWQKEAQAKLEAINANFAAACALLPAPIPMDTKLDITVYLNPDPTNPIAFDQLILSCDYAIADGDEHPTFGVSFGMLVHAIINYTIHDAVKGGVVMFQKIMQQYAAMAAITAALDKVTPERVDEIVATVFLHAVNFFDIDKR